MPRRSVGALMVLLLSGCSSPSAAPATPGPTVLPTAVPTSASSAPTAVPTSVPVAPTAPVATPRAVLVATPPPTIPAGATVAVPTLAASPAAQPAVSAASPSVPQARAIGELSGGPGALEPVETRNQAQDPGFTNPQQLQFELADPITTSDELHTFVNGVQELSGVSAVKSDGVHTVVEYDTSRVTPPRLRQRFEELGHAAKPGVDVQDAGAGAD